MKQCFLCLHQRKKTAGGPACECRAGHAVVLERKAVTGGKGHGPRFLCEAVQDALSVSGVSIRHFSFVSSPLLPPL